MKDLKKKHIYQPIAGTSMNDKNILKKKMLMLLQLNQEIVVSDMVQLKNRYGQNRLKT